MFQGNVDMPCPREPSTRHFLAWVLLEITETQMSHWHCKRRWRSSDIEQRGIDLWSTRASVFRLDSWRGSKLPVRRLPVRSHNFHEANSTLTNTIAC